MASCSAEEAFSHFLTLVVEGRAPDRKAYLRGQPAEIQDELEGLLGQYQWLRDGFRGQGAGLKGGLRVGDFQLVREIGRGGMGVVWEARDRILDRRVALKLLVSNWQLSATRLERFQREARAGGRVNHRGIVSVYGVGSTDELVFIAQELVVGGRTLAHRLKEQRHEAELPRGYFREMAELFADVADALAAAHEAGIVHRDVKPSNILLTRAGNPKIADFGMASIEGLPALTQTGERGGTPYYMSPEQLRALKPDARSDVFSLGATFYEALTLRRAFFGECQQEISERILHKDLLEPHKLCPGVPRDLSVICNKALEKRPVRRYRSMAEFVEDLRRYLRNDPVLARPISKLRRVEKWCRRHPVISMTSALGFGALVTVSGLLAVNVQTAHRLQIERDTAQAIVAFQSARFSNFDMERLGRDLYAGLVDKVATARPWIKEEDETDSRVQALEEVIAGADFTNLALEIVYAHFFAPALDAAAEDFAEQPLVHAELLQTLATALHECGLWQEAVQPQERALEIRLDALGVEHPKTLVSMSQSGSLLYDIGDLKAAARQLGSALERMRRVLGDEHPDTLTTVNDLALVRHDQGDFAGAQELEEESLATCRKVFGKEHQDTLIPMQYLAMTLAELGDPRRARELEEEVLEISRRILGDDHPDTLVAMDNLAMTLRVDGELDRARELHERVLGVSRKLYGDAHPDTLATAQSLARTLLAQGDAQGACDLQERVISVARETLGDGHPRLLTQWSNFAAMLHAQGEIRKAAVLQERLLDLTRRVKGENHPETLIAMGNLAVTFSSLGEHDRAREMGAKVLRLSHEVNGPDHARTWRAMGNLAAICFQSGEFDRARELFEDLLRRSQGIVEESHPSRLVWIGTLGSTLHAQQDYRAARKLREDGLELCRKTLGPDHPDTLRMMGGLAQSESALGNVDRARELEEAALEGIRKVLGDDHPHTLVAMHNLAITLDEAGQHARALEIANRALAGARSCWGDDHDDTRWFQSSVDSLNAKGNQP